MKSHQEHETQMLQRMLTTKIMEITKKSSSKEGITAKTRQMKDGECTSVQWFLTFPSSSSLKHKEWFRVSWFQFFKK
jgi:predicted transcriptional regulator